MLQKVRIFQKNRCSDVTKFHVHTTCFPHVARLKGTGVCEKKAKNFFDSLWFRSPPPPKAQSWQVQQQTALQDVAFFSQLVALMSAAASTLNLGGRGANSSISKMVVAFILQTPE